MAPTPGPWIVTEEGLETADCDVVLIAVTVGVPPLQIPHADNLQLMAAAPDLLAALKQLWAHARTHGWLLESRAVEVMDAATAAIAKAEGR